MIIVNRIYNRIKTGHERNMFSLNSIFYDIFLSSNYRICGLQVWETVLSPPLCRIDSESHES